MCESALDLGPGQKEFMLCKVIHMYILHLYACMYVTPLDCCQILLCVFSNMFFDSIFSFNVQFVT